jgi:predicted Ser/Thr protein kinase
MDKRKPKRYEAIKEIKTRNIVKELEQALENSKDETIGSEEQLFSIMIGQLQIPEDTLSDEMKKTFMDVIKLSPILKSPISQRGKKSQEKNSKALKKL